MDTNLTPTDPAPTKPPPTDLTPTNLTPTDPASKDTSLEPEIAPLDQEVPLEDLGRPARRVGRKSLVVALVAVLVVAGVSLGLAVARPWATSSPKVFNPVLGNSAAPVTIDIYEDFQCSICLEWGQMVFPQLRDGAIAAGEAKLVFHGLSSLGPESEASVRAAYAADQQGRFWDMWAALFAAQGAENSGAFSDAKLRAMAQSLGLDLSRFDADFASSAAQSVVSVGKADGKSHGITGTPTLIIAGQQYQGIDTYADLKAAIYAAQKSAPSASGSASTK